MTKLRSNSDAWHSSIASRSYSLRAVHVHSLGQLVEPMVRCVNILSPPHVVLLVGILVMGACVPVLTTGRMNPSLGGARGKFRRVLLYT
jgi:hypothetical protein